jgi:hypothetical protein
MKELYHNLKFFAIIAFFVLFYFIAIKPITKSYLEGFKTNDFSKFNKTISKRFTLNLV